MSEATDERMEVSLGQDKELLGFGRGAVGGGGFSKSECKLSLVALSLCI